MIRRRVPGLAAVAALVVLAPAAARAELARGVLGNGGVTAAGGGLTLRSTLGPPVVGGSASGGWRVCAGYWCAAEFSLVDAGGTGGDDPAGTLRFAFGPAVPNPARGTARFALALPAPGRVTLETFDVAGRRVGDPWEQSFAAGRYALAWDAKRAGPGIYFVRLRVDGVLRAERRIVTLR